MFSCFDAAGRPKSVELISVKNGWLSPQTICYQKLYKPTIVGDVRGVSLEAVENDVFASWTASEYQTQIQVQVDNEEWVTLDLVAPTISRSTVAIIV